MRLCITACLDFGRRFTGQSHHNSTAEGIQVCSNFFGMDVQHVVSPGQSELINHSPCVKQFGAHVSITPLQPMQQLPVCLNGEKAEQIGFTVRLALGVGQGVKRSQCMIVQTSKERWQRQVCLKQGCSCDRRSACIDRICFVRGSYSSLYNCNAIRQNFGLEKSVCTWLHMVAHVRCPFPAHKHCSLLHAPVMMKWREQQRGRQQQDIIKSQTDSQGCVNGFIDRQRQWTHQDKA